MRRREFIKGIVGSAVAARPFAARSQQAAMPVVGFLASRSPENSADLVTAFRAGLSETGFVENQNVILEFRWAEDQYDRLPMLAADLVAHQVAVIAATGGTPAGLAAKAATTKIPIVFLTGADPIQLGLVNSLNRPDGNLTGVTVLSNTLAPKQLELLREVAPQAKLVAFLTNPKSPITKSDTRNVQTAAGATGQQILILSAGNDSDLDSAFAALVQQKAEALLVQSDPFFNARPDKIVALATRYAIPAIYQWRDFPAAGGLMSYGTDLADAHRLVGVYTGKILQSAKLTDLPVQQLVKVQLVINLRTAKALGLNVPNTLIGRADEVIE
jgi:putative ABC transport system substrate-binding protein